MVRLYTACVACALLAFAGHHEADAEPVALSPLTPRRIVRTFSIEDGLPQSSVTAIIRTRDEHLWLGTFGGLVRFDGERFTTFRSLAGEGPSSDRVSALLEDDRGQLWIGTEDAGVSVMVDGHFERLPVCQGACRVYALLAQPGAVLVATADGLFAVDSGTHQAQRVSPLVFPWGAVDAQGDAYLAAPDALVRYQRGALVPVALPIGLATIGLLASLDGELWLSGDVMLFRRTGATWARVAGDQSWPAVNLLVRDGDGSVWVSNLQGQTSRIAPDGAIERAALDAGTLTAGLFADGSIWLGSNARGLWRVRPSLVALLDDPAVSLELPGLAITDDGGDGHWLGVNCGGLLHLDGRGRVLDRHQLGAVAACPWALHRAASGRLWIGTTDGRLGVHDPSDDQLRWIHAWSSLDRIGAILAVSERELLVAAGATTSRLTLAADGTATAVTALPALQGMRVIRIIPARAGGTWFVGDHGVVRLVGDQIAERIDVAGGLSTRFVRALHEEADGTLLLGTYGGGLNVVKGGRVVRVHREATGLHDDVVSCILEDTHGRLWLAGNRGVSSIGPDERARLATAATLDVRPIGASDGLSPEETNGSVDPACHRDRQGRLWFPLLSGFAVLAPSPVTTVSARAPSPPPVIDAVSLAGRGRDPRRAVRVRAGEQSLAVDLSVVSLSAPAATRLRFRLSSDREWVELTAGRRVVYPRLPWGEYDLEVIARVGDRDWSGPARLHIVHPRPWYWRPTSWIGFVIAIGLATLLLERAVRAYLRWRNARYLAAVEQRSVQLERDNRALVALARTDALTGLLNRRGFLDELAATWSDPASHPISVLVLDVDDFKRYNDEFGHGQGDECLRQVGQLLHANVRATTVVARMGGEEFVVLMRQASAPQALGLAQRLLSTLRAAAIPQAAAATHRVVTLSIGCATLEPALDANPEALLARADHAMYEAKRAGRDTARVASTSAPGSDPDSSAGAGDASPS